MAKFATVVLFVITVACKSPTSPDAVALGVPFELKAGATAQLPDGVRIKFDRVSADSRCPTDVQCVTAGDATVALLISNGGSTPFPLELHTDAGSQLSYSDHTFRLTALLPLPRSTRQINALEYVATFLVTAP